MVWYLVKQNWELTQLAVNELKLETYSGLGGDIWPLDQLENSNVCREMEQRRKENREFLPIAEDINALVMPIRSIAEDYHALCRSNGIHSEILELCVAGSDYPKAALGYDFGPPDGGYSIIESGVLAVKNFAISEEYLDKKYGLCGKSEMLDNLIENLGDLYDPSDDHMAVAITSVTC